MIKKQLLWNSFIIAMLFTITVIVFHFTLYSCDVCVEKFNNFFGTQLKTYSSTTYVMLFFGFFTTQMVNVYLHISHYRR